MGCLNAAQEEDPSKATNAERPPMKLCVTKVTSIDSVLTKNTRKGKLQIKKRRKLGEVSGMVENINLSKGKW